MAKRRSIVIVCDSLGVGELPDARDFGDEGSNTLGHILRDQRPKLPTLTRLGLLHTLPKPATTERPQSAYGRMAEVSAGKDTTTGHWEMMGLVVKEPFRTYPHGFPPEIIAEYERRIGRRTLGNKPASGTVILDELGEEHMRTGYPIVYTSADSVFQVAAHEEVIQIEEQHGSAAAVAGRRLGFVGQGLLETAAVEQGRQKIVIDELLQPPF